MNKEPIKYLRWLTRTTIILGLAMLASSCDDETPTSGSSGPGLGPFIYENSLSFSYDKIGINFTDEYYCFCDNWEDQVRVKTLKLFAGFDSREPIQEWSYWSLKVVLNDVSSGDTLQFPITIRWDQPEDLELFIYENPGEYSSQESETRGFIVIKRLSCGSDGGIEFYIESTIDSEFHNGGTVKVVGTFTAPLLTPPSG
jgi:hypothetical protein